MQVILLQLMRTPPQSAVNVQVRLNGDRPVGKTVLMEPSPPATGLQVDEALLNQEDDGIVVIHVSNLAPSECALRQAAEATIVIGGNDPSEQNTQEEFSCQTTRPDMNQMVHGEEWWEAAGKRS